MAGTKPFTSKTKWRTKLEKPQTREISDIPEKMAKRLGPGKILIPTPLDVDAAIREVPEGQIITMADLRANLTAQYGGDVACPLCSGIFTRIAAETAEEDRAAGREDISPYWRVVGPKGQMNPKFPGGVEAQKEKLAAEGHTFVGDRVVMA